MRRDLFKRLGGYVGPAVWELGRPLTEEEKRDELILLKRGSYVKRLGNKMQELYKTPFAKMSFEDLRAITLDPAHSGAVVAQSANRLVLDGGRCFYYNANCKVFC